MSPFWDGLLGSAGGLLIVGGALALLEWMEKRDARRHQLDLERVRQDKEIARLKAELAEEKRKHGNALAMIRLHMLDDERGDR